MARRAISRSCSAFSDQACLGGRPLIQDFLWFEGRVDKGTGIVALPGNSLNCRPVDRGFHHADAIPGHGLLTGYVVRSTIAQKAVQAFQPVCHFEVLPLGEPAAFGYVSAKRPAVQQLTSQPVA